MSLGRLAAITLTAAATILPAHPAWAPQMVANELAAQRTLGYQPCEPKVGQITDQQALEDGALAWATTPDAGGECSIEFSLGWDDPTALDWVAWHEVAHLSTMDAIAADPASTGMEDPFHCHPLFLELIEKGPAEKGGYGHEMCGAQ